MLPHPLTNFETQNQFNGVYLRNNLPNIKDGANIYKSIGTHWIALFMNGDNLTNLGSFVVFNLKIICNKSIPKIFTEFKQKTQ